MTVGKKENEDYISVIMGEGKLATRIYGPRNEVEEFVEIFKKDVKPEEKLSMRSWHEEMKKKVKFSQEFINALKKAKELEDERRSLRQKEL